jgi:hypothetical protein
MIFEPCTQQSVDPNNVPTAMSSPLRPLRDFCGLSTIYVQRNASEQTYKVYAEIGRTILAVQPTEGLFNVITLIVVPEKAFTVENLAVLDHNKRAKTLGQLKGHLTRDTAECPLRVRGICENATLFMSSNAPVPFCNH